MANGVENVRGYCIRDNKIYCSNGHVQEAPFGKYLMDLNYHQLHVMYQLSYDVACLLKAIGMPKELGHDLFYKGECSYKGILFQYRHNKIFRLEAKIDGRARFIYFADASQYIKNTEDKLNREPMELAKEAAEVGQEVYDVLDSVGVNGQTVMSPIRAYEKVVLSQMDLPKWSDCIDAGRYAYNCCKHNWVEAFKIGHWNKTWDYDIRSAYPNMISKLVDFRAGYFIPTDKFEEEAYYGFYKCKVHINYKTKVSPILYTVKENADNDDIVRYTPTGSWETYLTQDEINFINKWKIGTVDIVNGYWLNINKEDIKYPLKAEMERLYEEKEKNSGFRREIIKRIPNGCYGKLLEVGKDGFGREFNAVWGAQVETPVRLQVAELALNNGIVPIHIAVDGLLSDKELVLPNTDGLGSWKLESIKPAICISSGTVAIQGRDKTGDFSLDYDLLVDEIGKNPDSNSYSMKKQSPITLAVALHDNCWEKLGELREITKTVSIGYDEKKIYEGSPKTGGELLKMQTEGTPIDVSFVMMKELVKNK